MTKAKGPNRTGDGGRWPDDGRRRRPPSSGYVEGRPLDTPRTLIWPCGRGRGEPALGRSTPVGVLARRSWTLDGASASRLMPRRGGSMLSEACGGAHPGNRADRRLGCSRRPCRSLPAPKLEDDALAGGSWECSMPHDRGGRAPITVALFGAGVVRNLPAPPSTTVTVPVAVRQHRQHLRRCRPWFRAWARRSSPRPAMAVGRLRPEGAAATRQRVVPQAHP